jgi:uncharacterized membrane protein YebE (DUF533 family)
MASGISKTESLIIVASAAIGGMIAHQGASKENKLIATICGAIAAAAIAYICINHSKKNKLKEHCFDQADFSKCMAALLVTVKEVIPKSFAVAGTCSTGQLGPCLAAATSQL